MNVFIVLVVFSFATASLVPIIFISMREAIKHQRQEIVRDIQAIFAIPGNVSGGEIIPSFEFLKYKYFFERKAFAEADGLIPRDFSQIRWIIGTIPLVITCFIFNMYCFSVIFHYVFRISIPQINGLFSPDENMSLVSLAIISAYAGASLFMLKAFFRAIRNFDLSPHSFVGAWVNVMLGVVSAIVLIFGLMRMSKSIVSWNTPSVELQSLVLLTAFVVGRLPDLTNRSLLRAAHLRNYKREDVFVYKSFTAVPVEVIDGIDSEIRDRLTDFHINSVQNLAAANPLMLFVETPYGVYQIMDWVAQAQLCCSVGPASLLKLWRLGVRTIFDLERAVLNQDCRHTQLVLKIGETLLPDVGNAVSPLDQKTIVSAVRVRLDNPHVHRLRQLFLKIADRIGRDSRHLPPLLKCEFRHKPQCYFGSHDAGLSGDQAGPGGHAGQG